MCPCCQAKNINDLENTFRAPQARRDGRRYLRRGLSTRAKKLIAYLQQHAQDGGTVLDIGCGAGSLHHELLRQGVVDTVVAVDAASAYVHVASANADQLGLSDRVTYHQYDFAKEASRFSPADIVVLDRAICCYPYLEALLGGAAQRARRFLAISYPADRWCVRFVASLGDLILKIVGSGYHPFVHAEEEIQAVTRRAGLTQVYADRYRVWRIRVFARVEPMTS